MLTRTPCKKNLQGALDLSHLEVVEEYVPTNQDWARKSYTPSELPGTHISRFDAPQPGKWRLIIDPSYPKNHDINDGISKPLCKLTIDEAIEKSSNSAGWASLLAKIDIRSAFRPLPIHPADSHLLAMHWSNSLCIATCQPFGLRSAPKLFNILADLLSWIIHIKGVSFCIHYSWQLVHPLQTHAKLT